jgi:hypothetical protein
MDDALDLRQRHIVPAERGRPILEILRDRGSIAVVDVDRRR